MVDKEGGGRLRAGKPGVAQSFQWMETPTGELVLMSIANNRYLRIDRKTGEVMANSPGPLPDGGDGVRFIWSHAKQNKPPGSVPTFGHEHNHRVVQPVSECRN